MKRSLLELLRSPIDSSPLDLETEQENGGEILSGHLADEAGNRYPIVDGLPLFAEAGGDDPTFGFKWRKIGGSYGHDEPTRQTRQQWYLDRFGFGSRETLREFLGSSKLVLDAGTGTGVDAAMFAESGSTIVATDLSRDAAQAAYRHVGSLPNVHVLQADLRALPLSASFDYISCDQVLHHTPDAASSFAALTRHLREQGQLAIYVYNRKGPIREFTDDYIRERTTRMPAANCYRFCEAVTRLGKALSDLHAEVTIPESLPLLEIDAETEDVQRFIYWNMIKCFWNDEYDFETNVVVNFDWYHPRYASRHEPEEVRGWFERHGLGLESFEVVKSGIAARGTRAS